MSHEIVGPRALVSVCDDVVEYGVQDDCSETPDPVVGVVRIEHREIKPTGVLPSRLLGSVQKFGQGQRENFVHFVLVGLLLDFIHFYLAQVTDISRHHKVALPGEVVIPS
eukprot:scaffold110_cov315-Pavlova_lutheri.AAC.28